MKIKSFEFSYIKAYKNLHFDLEKTSVLIGQNDHGKSSILKVIDIALNQITNESLELGALHPDLAERLLPLFPVNAKARRITIYYETAKGNKELHITVRTDLSFTLLEKIEKSAKTTPAAIAALKALRDHNKFVLIPALRDPTSPEFQNLLSEMLREYGLSKIIPQKAGGTPKEYRTLKDIKEKISNSITPYINNALLPEIEQHFGFKTQHKLALKFDVDVQDVGEWILDNLSLGFKLTDDGDASLALSEAGSGVQSGVLLALQRLSQKAAQNPQIQFILAVEEPEAFLHPQRQKELYQDILAAQSKNLRVIVTTHSPYIVSETEFSRLGFVKKDGIHSALHIAEIKNKREEDIFNSYSSDINSALFFADKIILVEGDSDLRVIKKLMQKRFGAASHNISVISAAGNRNFSPYLNMIKAWSTAKIPHLIVTDFDSLTKETDRAIITGAKAANYTLSGEQTFHTKIDFALDKDEDAFSAIAKEATTFFSASGLNVFVFTSDLEYAILDQNNKKAASVILSNNAANGVDYSTGYNIEQLKRSIGSKGIPMNGIEKPPFKKPFIHESIAETILLENAHPDIIRLLDAIEALQ